MALDPNVPIKCTYGHITEVFPADGVEEEYYIVQVSLENSVLQDETEVPMIPIEQTVEELSALYGPPSAIIGRRVRIEYTGRDYKSGIARIVSDLIPGGGTQMNKIKSRGFKYAVPGKGGS